MNRSAAPLAVQLVIPAAATAENFTVNPQAGNSGFSAIFDAALGERINADSSAVGCDVSFDEKTGLASGRCAVPLTSITVDNDSTQRVGSSLDEGPPLSCRPRRCAPARASVAFGRAAVAAEKGPGRSG